MKKQKGYLLIVALVLIVIVGFVSTMITSMFAGSAQINSNILQSNAAFYIASSGLEAAKRDITSKGVGCEAINGASQYTNNSLFNGAYTVTGANSVTTTTLNAAISSNATTIPLTSTNNFASVGTVVIDNEFIDYGGISGNALVNLTRGAGGTTAAAHTISANVIQNQCVLTAVGGVPSINAAEGKRTLQQTLIGSSFSLNNFGTLPGAITPGLVVAGSISLKGNSSVINTSVTGSSANFKGSTIVAGGAVSINGSANTKISDGSGGEVASSVSGRNGIKGDIIYSGNYDISNINFSSLWDYYFTLPKSTLESTVAYIPSSRFTGTVVPNQGAGNVIWTSNPNLHGNVTVGSPSNPVILIIEGNLNASGNVKIYGFVYITGAISLNGTVMIKGSVAIAGAVNLNDGSCSKGTNSIIFDSGILTQLGLMNSGTSTHYLAPRNSREVFN